MPPLIHPKLSIERKTSARVYIKAAHAAQPKYLGVLSDTAQLSRRRWIVVPQLTRIQHFHVAMGITRIVSIVPDDPSRWKDRWLQPTCRHSSVYRTRRGDSLRANWTLALGSRNRCAVASCTGSGMLLARQFHSSYLVVNTDQLDDWCLRTSGICKVYEDCRR